MKAVYLALLTFTEKFRLKVVHVQIENMTALSHLENGGYAQQRDAQFVQKSLVSLLFNHITLTGLVFLLFNHITLTAEYIQGVLDIKADICISRVVSGHGPVRYGLVCVKAVSSGSEIDGVAARSREQSNQCISTDYRLPYAFPPLLLIGRVLMKARKEKVCLNLVTPN